MHPTTVSAWGRKEQLLDSHDNNIVAKASIKAKH
jgi:hypothetical protein